MRTSGSVDRFDHVVWTIQGYCFKFLSVSSVKKCEIAAMKHVSNLTRPRGHITFTCRMFVYLWESSLHHRSALLHYVQAAVNLSSSEISRSPECA
jgi:hypothetical protein